MVFHNTIKTLPVQCHSMSLRKNSGCLNIKGFGMKSTHNYLKNWQLFVLQCNGCVKGTCPQVYVEECKYTDVEKQQCNMLTDDDDGFFEV